MENDRMLIDKLRQEVISGKLTYDDIVRRLTIAIETEYLKESPNIDFIDSCEDFLWEIETEWKQKFVSISDQYLKTIEQHLEVVTPKNTRKGRVIEFAKRIALISAAFAVLIFFTQGAIHFEWFTQHPSTDEQQYIIQGHDITLELIQSALAEHTENAYLKTKNWDDLCNFLGFVPHSILPQALQASTVTYFAHIQDGFIVVDALFEDSEQNTIAVLKQEYYLDFEEAYLLIEQEAQGDYLVINGCQVYCNSNLEKQSFSWLKNSTLSLFSGTFDANEGIHIIELLLGDSQNE